VFGPVVFDPLFVGGSNDDFKCGYTRRRRKKMIEYSVFDFDLRKMIKKDLAQ
jgi:hypothetical protein